LPFSTPETALIGGLFAAGLILGITSILTLWAAEHAGLKNYMLKSVIVAGFVFALSEAVLAASSLVLPDVLLDAHFLLEAVAISTVVYGVIGYYRNIMTAARA